MPLRSRKAMAVVVGALCLFSPAAMHAQDFPSRVIRVVVAFPAGGPTDFVARLVADRLKLLLGQNVIVENKPGANGAIGADYVAKGEADMENYDVEDCFSCRCDVCNCDDRSGPELGW